MRKAYEVLVWVVAAHLARGPAVTARTAPTQTLFA